jgi:glyoxylase-like metal-dependent hydrolase (beta-lactamase superfamily II)
MDATSLTVASSAMGAPRVDLPTGVHVLERGWLSSNSVLFEEGDRLSVVDTGYISHARQLAGLIDRIGRGRPLARIVNTHLHSDHVGGNALLARRGAVSIQIPGGDADAVRAWDVERLSYRATGQRCARFGFDRVLRAGDALELGGLAWRVLAGAGHDPHMVMLYQSERRILISADALWEDGFGAIFPEIEGQPGFAQQRVSLNLIAGLQPALVIPGHGKPFRQVDAALQRADRRLDALQSSPQRNARHILKVLVKFWLLQVRQAPLPRLIEHFGRARYAHAVHQRHFAQRSFAHMLEQTARELCAAGAAALDGVHIRNVQGSDAE